MSGKAWGAQTNHIRPDDAVWSAVFYLYLPRDIDLPQTIEQWPCAKYIVYKSYMGKHGENLVGYAQFHRRMTGVQLAIINPGIVWKHQQGSNFSCIRYVKERFNDKICRPVVELGEHWPFRPAPTVIANTQSASESMCESKPEEYVCTEPDKSAMIEFAIMKK